MATVRFGGGATLERAQTATVGSTDWQEVTNINGDITVPGGQATKTDKTTHTSIRTVGRRMQHGAGLTDLSDFQCTLLFDCDDSVHQAILADWELGTERDYRYTRAEGTTKIIFRGPVGNFQETDPMSDNVKMAMAIYVNTIDYTS